MRKVILGLHFFNILCQIIPFPLFSCSVNPWSFLFVVQCHVFFNLTSIFTRLKSHFWYIVVWSMNLFWMYVLISLMFLAFFFIFFWCLFINFWYLQILFALNWYKNKINGIFYVGYCFFIWFFKRKYGLCNRILSKIEKFRYKVLRMPSCCVKRKNPFHKLRLQETDYVLVIKPADWLSVGDK